MRSSDLSTCLAPILALWLWPQPPAAQAQGSEVFHDEIDVRLAEIEVVVTDAEGQPVTGLTRGDFEVRQGRKRLPVTHFSAFEDGHRITTGSGVTGSPRSMVPWTPEDRLHLVLFIDHAYMAPGELEDVIPALRGFLARGLRPKDRVMLVEANHSLDVVQGLTSVPELVDTELGKLKQRSPRGRAQAEVPQLMREIERVARRGTGISTLSRDEHPMILKSQIDNVVAQIHSELSRSTQQLHRLIPALAGLPGRKEILYVGGSMPSDAGRRLYSAWDSAFGSSSVYQQSRTTTSSDNDVGRLINVNPTAAAGQAQTNELFSQVARRANASGVKLHLLDSGGLRRSRSFVTSRTADVAGNSGRGDSADLSQRLGDPRVLRTMAEETGGRALIHSRDFESVLDAVARDLRTYYMLAFRPPKGVGELHEVRIKLKGKKHQLTVRHRRAYRALDRDRTAIGRVVSALILDEADNPLGIELAAEAPKNVEGQPNLVLQPLYVIFSVDKLQWVEDPRGHRSQLSIYLTSGSFEQGAAEVKKTVVPLHFTSEELSNARGRNIEYKLELPMAAGSHKVAVALRDDLRPLMATVVLDLRARIAGPS